MNILKKFNEYKKRRWFQGMVLGVICFILGCGFSYWLVHHTINLEEDKFEKELKLAEPNMSFFIKEISSSVLQLEISSNNPNSSEVKKIYFNFDIPGVLTNVSNENKKFTENCEIYSRLLNGQSHEAISETVLVECNSIMPKGLYEVHLNYKHADMIIKDIWLKNYGNLNYFKYPSLDMHDFNEINYFWEFSGKLQSKKTCLDLSKLNYISIDNKRLVEFQKIFGKEWNISLWEDIRNPCSENYGNHSLFFG